MRPLGRSALRGHIGDERLAALAGDGDGQAFATLFERYHQPVYRYCRSIVHDDCDAQDALQSTFVSALTALRRRQRDAPLRPWLFRIAHNESITVIRRRSPASASLSDELALSAPSAAEHAEQRERFAQLVADLQDLPVRQRGALVMRELSGLSHEEIALALETSTGTAKQAVFEARAALADFAVGREMSCVEICRVISDGDRRSFRGRKVRAHLRDCSACAEFASAMSDRAAALHVLALPLAPLVAVQLFNRVVGGGMTQGAAGAAGGALGTAGTSGGAGAGASAGGGGAGSAGASAGAGSAGAVAGAGGSASGVGAGAAGALAGKVAALGLAGKALAAGTALTLAGVGVSVGLSHGPAAHPPATAICTQRAAGGACGREPATAFGSAGKDTYVALGAQLLAAGVPRQTTTGAGGGLSAGRWSLEGGDAGQGQPGVETSAETDGPGQTGSGLRGGAGVAARDERSSHGQAATESPGDAGGSGAQQQSAASVAAQQESGATHANAGAAPGNSGAHSRAHAADHGNGVGHGNGNGIGHANGHSAGHGNGNGNASGNGNAAGNGVGNGNGNAAGNGDGVGNGVGNSHGNGTGGGNGNGNGVGNGNGNAGGNGNGAQPAGGAVNAGQGAAQDSSTGSAASSADVVASSPSGTAAPATATGTTTTTSAVPATGASGGSSEPPGQAKKSGSAHVPPGQADK